MPEVDAIAVVSETLVEVLEDLFDVAVVHRDYVEPVAALATPLPLADVLDIFDHHGLEAAGMQILVDDDDRRYRTVFAQSDVGDLTGRADAA